MAAHKALPQYIDSQATSGWSATSKSSNENGKAGFWSLPEWKKGLRKDSIVTSTLFCCHIIFLLKVQKNPKAGFWGAFGFEVFSSRTDCNQLSHERTGWSFLVNTMAALIGTFSSTTLQALSAPTRRQLDLCHRDNNFMEIGVQSFHNIVKPYLGWRKRILWVLLMLMTLPFHIL
jgi:hypothetical protein